MVSRASGGLGDDTIEAQCRQIQFVDECFNNPDRVVLRHVVIQAVRQQRSLPPVLAFHETFHPAIPNSRTLTYHVWTFSHALGHGPAFCEQKGTTADGARAADRLCKISWILLKNSDLRLTSSSISNIVSIIQ